MAVAHVAMPVAAWQLFDYWVPDGLEVARGDVVRARLGNRRSVGLVIATDSAREVERRLQPIEARADVPRLAEDVLALGEFVARYYQAPPGLAYALLVPPLTRVRRSKSSQAGAASAGAAVDAMGERQPQRLNDAQAHALEVVGAAEDRFAVTLLHGVTGSGKTDVYLAAAARAVARGAQVLILVPEINLTPQFAGRVAATLGVACVALHSGLAAGERRANWQAAASGEAAIVLATRLGVFTPLPRLALIAVDEEHDESFRQQDGVRYHARDLAIWRARRRNVPIVLGSATPSLETWVHARRGRYALATLASRADPRARLPAIRFVPNRGPDVRDGGVGSALRQGLVERLARREQSLLFVNRRGYAPSLKCVACGWESQCARCAARLVVHRAPDRLRCHHCGHARAVPRACPECGNVDLLPQGYGTQRLEQALRAEFPSARIARVDRDSTRGRDTFAKMREAVAALDIDILVGTQMLAKGHDFPRLTLVGVLGADNALYSADFRASERLAALLTQVAGRAGRAGHAGEVIVQTDFPDHAVYRALAAHDYARFADDLVRERSAALLPPRTRIALLVAEAHAWPDVERFLDAAHAEANRLRAAHADVEAFAPMPAAMPRRRGFERGQVLVQSASRRALQAFLPEWRDAVARCASARVRFVLDVDPTSF